MKKFEVGKIYMDDEGKIEIKVTKRTDKQLTFIYTKKNWYERNIEKEYKRKIQRYHLDYETINLGTHWSEPSVAVI